MAGERGAAHPLSAAGSCAAPRFRARARAPRARLFWAICFASAPSLAAQRAPRPTPGCCRQPGHCRLHLLSPHAPLATTTTRPAAPRRAAYAAAFSRRASEPNTAAAPRPPHVQPCMRAARTRAGAGLARGFLHRARRAADSAGGAHPLTQPNCVSTLPCARSFCAPSAPGRAPFAHGAAAHGAARRSLSACDSGALRRPPCFTRPHALAGAALAAALLCFWMARTTSGSAYSGLRGGDGWVGGLYLNKRCVLL